MKKLIAINIVIGVIVAFSLGYYGLKNHNAFEQEVKSAKVETAIEKSLFPIMVQAQPKEYIFARPMWVADAGHTLTVYCEYFGDRLPEAREKVRDEMVLVVKKWAETQPTKYQFMYVTFTDEIISPEKK